MEKSVRYSDKINVQMLTETLLGLEVNRFVVSPGSRNGALMMEWANHPQCRIYSIVDERSAAYVGLGMAQATKKPVVLCCTSGSAAANYYPAVTEAFYQNIPLIFITADRPAHFTDIFDGQTIRQENLFEKHVYHSVQLSESEDDESITHNFLAIKKAVHSCYQNSGPVHINIPMDEPLYGFTQERLISFDQIGKPQEKSIEIPWEQLKKGEGSSREIMLLLGLHHPDNQLKKMMAKLADYPNITVLTETTSNCHHPEFINRIDATIFTLSDEEKEQMRPDLLITLGQNVISKKIKQYLRAFPPQHHWHIDKHWHPDTYFSLDRKLEIGSRQFIEQFLENISPVSSDYKKMWENKWVQKNEIQQAFLAKTPWSDLKVFENIVANYPSNYHVHYSNSSIIRYSQLFSHTGVEAVFCNRGTSGIDGSTSTAAGYAIEAAAPVVLVSGDISFFYDSNGLWNNYLPPNFRIILLNNGGGNIFRIIPGPDQTQALETYFETRHQLSAKPLAALHRMDYFSVDNLVDLSGVWEEFYRPSSQVKILEIDTTQVDSAQILRNFWNL